MSLLALTVWSFFGTLYGWTLASAYTDTLRLFWDHLDPTPGKGGKRNRTLSDLEAAPIFQKTCPRISRRIARSQ